MLWAMEPSADRPVTLPESSVSSSVSGECRKKVSFFSLELSGDSVEIVIGVKEKLFVRIFFKNVLRSRFSKMFPCFIDELTKSTQYLFTFALSGIMSALGTGTVPPPSSIMMGRYARTGLSAVTTFVPGCVQQ